MTVYTLALWRVKPAEEDSFVAAWNALAAGTKAEFPDASAVLLRDRDDPRLFISTGPWTSVEQIDAWRASAVFTTSVDGIRSHLEHFEPHTMDVVVTVERAP